jgi:hypothetical protein
MVRDQFVTEHPEIPDIDAGITPDGAEQCRSEVERQGPNECDCNTHVPNERREATIARTHATGINDPARLLFKDYL